TTDLNSLTVVGANHRMLYPSPRPALEGIEDIYSRQSLLFGSAGQQRLSEAKIGIIGLGGVGSLVSQWLSHLGVGHIVGIDFDYLEPTNRPRVVGATAWDAGEPFIRSRFGMIRWVGRKLARRKVDIACRVARAANKAIKYDAVAGNIVDLATA